ncbi:hypothetical protein D046_3904 [Vibrio parahaemolyticus V-223/04]|nr:hypothetical protein D046_3904 [Vibrio parahaemolyticus V-223/04]
MPQMVASHSEFWCKKAFELTNVDLKRFVVIATYNCPFQFRAFSFSNTAFYVVFADGLPHP